MAVGRPYSLPSAVLWENRDSAAACCDDYLVCIEKCADSLNLNDLLRLGSCYNTHFSHHEPYDDHNHGRDDHVLEHAERALNRAPLVAE